MLERLRQSLALRLAVQYALVFALASTLLFGVLYWFLAEALDNRERAALVKQTADFADAFERGSLGTLRARYESSPDIGSFFVRLIAPGDRPVFEKWPPDWVETQVQNVPLGAFTLQREFQTVRIPQNALRDYTIATKQWPG